MSQSVLMRLRGCLVFAALASLLGCGKQASLPTEVLLDCSSASIGREILKLTPGASKVQNLSFMPARTGRLTVNEGDYFLEFTDMPVFKLRFRINRYTGDGTRELVDENGRVGPRDFWQIACKPYEGKPL